MSQLPTLCQTLQHPDLYPHPVTKFELRETHISWVLLTGPFAYKIKKPVDFGFVDFSSLEHRRFFCAEEIRLNRRLAPDIYVEVVPISGTPEHPSLSGKGAPFEFAVKMRQFPADATLDQLQPHHMQPELFDQLAQEMAAFHHHIARAEQHTAFGSPEFIAQVIAEVFQQFSSGAPFSDHHHSLGHLRNWLAHFQADHLEDFRQRKTRGFIRECHGDLHLANLVLLGNRIIPFDGIEFSERLRWIDVINDIGFTVMDLQARGHPALASRFLNRYLEWTGDYDGLGVFPFYEVYRALVRVKVAGLSLAQDPASPRLLDDVLRYLSTAQRCAQAKRPWLVIMHGVSGSGKSTVAETLLESAGAIRLRSDVERKRLFGLSPSEQSAAALKPDMYGTEATRNTYDRLKALAQRMLSFGYPVIVDAAFLERHHRDSFRTLAAALEVPFLMLDMHAAPATRRQRVVARAAAPGEASEADLAVLRQQEQSREPLGPDEQALALRIQSDAPFDPAQALDLLESHGEGGRHR